MERIHFLSKFTSYPFKTVRTSKGTMTLHPSNLYHMPAEWAPHDACLMQYPHNPSTFRLPQAKAQFLQIAKAIATDGEEPVIIFCPTERDASEVQQQLKADENITTKICPSNDSWCRDMGPTFVINRQEGKRLGMDWNFNAWGGIYSDFRQDQLVAQRMCDILNREMKILTTAQKVPVVLEGGSFHVDGEGTVLTTKECLLNANRNPTKSQQELAAIICEHLGAKKIIWLPHGVDGDEDTNGHVDNFACFLKPGHIILSWTDNQENDNVNYERCRAALKLLEQEKDAQGRRLTIHKLQLPPPIYYNKEEVKGLQHFFWLIPPRKVGERMAGSYANFYVANKAVVVPQYGYKETDDKAIETLTALFPDRTVVGVPSKEILIGGGNIHCITQQVPTV